MNSHKFLKIESIKQLKKYGLPIPETIFIYDFKKQEKEIDKFLKEKRMISIRSDKKGKSQFCPNIPRCPRFRAKSFIKKINKLGHAVILHEYLAIKKGRTVAGHILILKNHILMELVSQGAVSHLDRKGEVEERIKFLKTNLREVEHSGRRLTKSGVLSHIAKIVKKIPSFKILDFVLMKSSPYFYQIQDDKTAKKLETISD